MSLITIVESLQKRPLTAAEVESLNEFQRTFQIDNEDPLIVVLAMLARNQIALDHAPELLQQKVNETIEYHRVVLREQSVVIAKELIVDIGRELQVLVGTVKRRWVNYIGFFAGGATCGALIMWLVQTALR